MKKFISVLTLSLLIICSGVFINNESSVDASEIQPTSAIKVLSHAEASSVVGASWICDLLGGGCPSYVDNCSAPAGRCKTACTSTIANEDCEWYYRCEGTSCTMKTPAACGNQKKGSCDAMLVCNTGLTTKKCGTRTDC